ncbi:MAG: DUF779 domain-containing protein [Polyangiaceae bacterium]|nr:DUF779 domain-containing protein [Polyangiaceae bacterium]
MDKAPPRVLATEAAAGLIRRLMERHGRLMFHQSGGCCDGSAPMCYPQGELRIGERDVLLGEIEGCPVYIGGAQFELWKHTQLIIDAVPGRGAGFSIEAPEGMRFLTRSRVFDEEERAALEAAGVGRGVRG